MLSIESMRTILFDVFIRSPDRKPLNIRSIFVGRDRYTNPWARTFVENFWAHAMRGRGDLTPTVRKRVTITQPR
jgi:hypothetical protein